MCVYVALDTIKHHQRTRVFRTVEIKYYKNSFIRRKQSIRIIYAICDPACGNSPNGVQKSHGCGSGVALRLQIGKDLKRGRTTCCAQRWGLCKLALGLAASASTGSRSSPALGSPRGPAGSAETRQRRGPPPAPQRRGPAPLRGLRKLRPLEVSSQPPNLLPGVRHHCLARPGTGKPLTRQPSASHGRRETDRAEGQETRANANREPMRGCYGPALCWAWPSGAAF